MPLSWQLTTLQDRWQVDSSVALSSQVKLTKLNGTGTVSERWSCQCELLKQRTDACIGQGTRSTQGYQEELLLQNFLEGNSHHVSNLSWKWMLNIKTKMPSWPWFSFPDSTGVSFLILDFNRTQKQVSYMKKNRLWMWFLNFFSNNQNPPHTHTPGMEAFGAIVQSYSTSSR